jgi:hypothetical protein
LFDLHGRFLRAFGAVGSRIGQVVNPSALHEFRIGQFAILS